MKTSKLLLLGIGCALVLPSCSSKKDKDAITAQTIGGYFNVITDLETGEKTVKKDVTYDILRNYGDQTAQLTFNGIKLPDNQSYPSFYVGPVKWDFNNAWTDIHATSVTTTANSGICPTISNLTFDMWVKYFNDYIGTTYTDISYTVNNRYLVHSYPSTLAAWGTTVAKIEGTSYDHTTENSLYTVELDVDKGLANMSISNFSVAVDNSVAAVTIKELPYTLDENGNLSITAESVMAYTAGSTEPTAPGMPVSNLVFKLTRGIIDLTYTITVDGTTYNVTCTDK